MKKLLIVIMGAVLAVGTGITLSVMNGPAKPPTVLVEAPETGTTTIQKEDGSMKIVSSNSKSNEAGDTIFTAWIGILVIAIIIAAGFLYFLPTIYAYRTKHPKRDVVLLINLFAGWTFAGWIAAMIFAAIKQNRTLEEELDALEKLQAAGTISYTEYSSKRASLLS